MIQIKDISKDAPAENVVGVIEKRQEAVTKAGKAYLSLKLKDQTGSIDAKLWDYSPDKHGPVKEGSVVHVWASVDVFNGSLQLNIKQIEEGLEDATEFAKRSRFDVESMWGDIVNLIGTFKEPLTKYVCEEILLKHEVFITAYKKAPAAKTVHNAWYGGLLEHVHSLTTIAEPIIKHYQRYNPNLSRDKVMFGLIMHDAGKIIEYDYNSPAFGMTGIGIFTNHLVLGPAWVYEKANDYMDSFLSIPDKSITEFKNERAHLMHVLAAHHGILEWGSPVKPASLEAVLVHQLDMIDSKMLHAIELIEGKPGEVKGFSERSRFEATPFYNYQN